MSLLRELQRRNVIRVATAYVVTAWLVIQVIETIFPAFGFTDKAIRVAVVILGIGFIPAVISAWVFEWTPEGIRRDEDARDAVRSPGRKRNFDRGIVIVLLLGVVYFAVDKFLLAPERAAVREAQIAEQARQEAVKGFFGDRSIAVVPFDNMSSDPEQQHFADGVAEEVLNLLARIRDLRVISRSSAFALRGLNLNVPQMAERLDVAHILEGSVRRTGDRVRVTAQLIEARTDTHLWSKTYTREIENVFEIQDEIAADVVANLHIELPKPLRHSKHIDPEVRSLLVQARQLWDLGQEDVGRKMLPLVTRALEMEPDYVPALNLLAMAYFSGAKPDLSFEDNQRLIEETRDRVRQLDPDDGFLLAWDAWNLAILGEYEEAAAMYSRALATDLTESRSIRVAGFFAAQIGKPAVAVALTKHAAAIDPLCHSCRAYLATTLMYVGDYERARREMERFISSTGHGHEDYVMALLLDGKPQQALEFLDSLGDEMLPDRTRVALLASESMTQHSLGNADKAKASLAELMASDFFDERFVSLLVAEVAAWMGNTELAFERLFEMQATNFQFLKRRAFSPMWRNLHDDPRWPQWLDGYGLSKERLDAIEFDPDLPD